MQTFPSPRSSAAVGRISNGEVTGTVVKRTLNYFLRNYLGTEKREHLIRNELGTLD